MGGKENTGTPIERPLPDARRAPPVVAMGAQSVRSGECEGEGGEAKAEAEGEMSGSEERESKSEEGTVYGVEEREPTKWEKVVELVQLELRNRLLPEEATWQAVVLIPKGVGD